MIALYIAIALILVAFLISQSMNKNQSISTKSICVICNAVVDEKFTFEEDALSFCQKHFNTYKENKWVITETCESSPDNEEASVILYNKKKSLYENGTLGFLKSSYKEVDGKIITTLDFYQIKKPH